LGVFPLSDIIPPWFPILIYHLGDEQYTHWWPQFRDVSSPSRYDQSIKKAPGQCLKIRNDHFPSSPNHSSSLTYLIVTFSASCVFAHFHILVFTPFNITPDLFTRDLCQSYQQSSDSKQKEWAKGMRIWTYRLLFIPASDVHAVKSYGVGPPASVHMWS
jgi:hypothetical protein